jgi:hypothetical protein
MREKESAAEVHGERQRATAAARYEFGPIFSPNSYFDDR